NRLGLVPADLERAETAVTGKQRRERVGGAAALAGEVGGLHGRSPTSGRRLRRGRFTSSGIRGSRRIWHLSRPWPGWLPRLHRAGPSASLDATPGIAPAGTQTARHIVAGRFPVRPASLGHVRQRTRARGALAAPRRRDRRAGPPRGADPARPRRHAPARATGRA